MTCKEFHRLGRRMMAPAVVLRWRKHFSLCYHCRSILRCAKLNSKHRKESYDAG